MSTSQSIYLSIWGVWRNFLKGANFCFCAPLQLLESPLHPFFLQPFKSACTPYLSIYLAIHPYIYISIYLSIHLYHISIYLSIYTYLSGKTLAKRSHEIMSFLFFVTVWYSDTGYSLIILFFPYFEIFLLQRWCSNCLVCVQPLAPRENGERQESGIFLNLRKQTQYLMNTLYIINSMDRWRLTPTICN